MRNNKGITLIALVVTIIVLLILAGVSIAMLTGDNGILKQSKKAKTDTANAEAVERINMELNAMKAKILAGTAIADGDEDTMMTNLGEGYTVTYDSTEGLTVTAVPTGVTLTEKGSITPAGVVTPAKQ